MSSIVFITMGLTGVAGEESYPLYVLSTSQKASTTSIPFITFPNAA